MVMPAMRQQVRTPRKDRIWAYKVLAGQSHTAGTPVLENLLDDFETAFGNVARLTVARIIGTFSYTVTTPGIGSHRVFAGILKSQFSQAATDSDPQDDTHQNDWLWRGHGVFPNSIHHDGTNYQTPGINFNIDVRGMRKLTDRDRLQLAMDAGASLTYDIHLSILLLR